MQSFNERFGLPKKGLQINSIDNKTRVRVWNELQNVLWPKIFNLSSPSAEHYIALDRKSMAYAYVVTLWSDVLGWNTNEIPAYIFQIIGKFHTYIFYNNMSWHQYLYFIERTLINFIDLQEHYKRSLISEYEIEKYTKGINKIFEEEACGYRFIGTQLSPIVDDVELTAIGDALESSNSLSNVKIHLQGALMHLSDRLHPDYSNSVKESISAIEALCQMIVGRPDATLSQTIETVEKKLDIHKELKMGIRSLYDWSNKAATGIRHANKRGESETFDNAKLALVLCSGIANYLIVKSNEAGIQLKN